MTTVRIEVLEAGTGPFREAAEALLQAWPGLPLERAVALAATPGGFLVLAGQERPGDAGGALVLLEEAPGGELRPWLASLHVRPELRGRGLGRRLAGRAGEEARRRGHRVLVTRVEPEDEAALFTAERWGYVRQEIVLLRELPAGD